MESMLIAQIEPPQNIEGGDFYCRRDAPGICLAREEGVYVVNLTSKYRFQEEIADPGRHFNFEKYCTNRRPKWSQGSDVWTPFSETIPPWEASHFFDNSAVIHLDV